jgi:bacillithiol system protein YtxJ
MNWKHLNSTDDLKQAIELSNKQPIVLFKHSTRCSVSMVAKRGLEQFWDLDMEAYHLDLIAHRDISNQIASIFGVKHESPQILVIRNEKAVYNASHGQIDVDDLRPFAK